MPYTFTTPTVSEGPIGGHRLFSFYKQDRGVSLIKRAYGVYDEVRYPYFDKNIIPDGVFIGGYEYTVSDDEAASLTAAGYGSRLNRIPPFDTNLNLLSYNSNATVSYNSLNDTYTVYRNSNSEFSIGTDYMPVSSEYSYTPYCLSTYSTNTPGTVYGGVDIYWYSDSYNLIKIDPSSYELNSSFELNIGDNFENVKTVLGARYFRIVCSFEQTSAIVSPSHQIYVKNPTLTTKAG